MDQCWLTNKDLHLLCADIGCRQEDLPRVMDNRDEWQERVRELHTFSIIWWWSLSLSLYIYIYMCVCVCVCIYIYIYIYMYLSVYAYIYNVWMPVPYYLISFLNIIKLYPTTMINFSKFLSQSLFYHWNISKFWNGDWNYIQYYENYINYTLLFNNHESEIFSSL